MSTVKRYDLVGETDGNCNLNDARMESSAEGVYVKHKDYAESERYGRQADITIENLERKVAQLAAELKQSQIDAGCYKRGMEASNERLVQVAAENAGLINSSIFTLQDGRPPYGFYASEWFIAKLKNGEYAALKALPEEYSHDYRTNDGTYYTKDWVVGWMQTPDTEYRPNFKTPATDSFLAEVRADHDELICASLLKKACEYEARAKEVDCHTTDNRYRFAAAMFRGFAAQLRQGSTEIKVEGE